MKCRVCHQAIAYGADNCPFCGAKQFLPIPPIKKEPTEPQIIGEAPKDWIPMHLRRKDRQK